MKQQRYSKQALAALAVTGLVGGYTSPVQAQDAEAEATEAEEEEVPKWEHSAGLGFTLTGGNSESTLFIGDYLGSKKWGHHEVEVGAVAGYGEADDVVNNNFGAAYGQYNYLFGPQKRWFGYGRAEGRFDEVADIDYRFPVSLGIGYYFLKRGVNDNDRFDLSAEAGPGYVWEKIGGVTDEYATVYAGEKFVWEISEKTKFWQSASITPEISDFENYTVEAEVGVETTLAGDLVLRSVFTDSYRSQPAAGREKNDYKLITSIAYKF